MANTIKLKRSSTASSVPATGDLAVGELAVNTADKKLYTKHGSAIIELNGSNTDTTYTAGTNVSISGSNVISSTDTNTNTWRSISDSTSTTSSTVSASQTAVKSAYDKGNHSHPYAASSHTHSYVSDTGDSMTGTLTITKDADALFIKTSTNAAGAEIAFSDNVSAYSQIGRITFEHSDTYSYGSGSVFTLGSTEATTTILANGKLMYKEGIYSKPSSGTGAGTRKDSNWDTAYTHSQASHAPSNANYITNNNQLTNGAGYITSYTDTNTWRSISDSVSTTSSSVSASQTAVKAAYDRSWPDTNTNYYLTGVTKSSNTLTFAVTGASNPTYTFGSNAFNSTSFTTNTGTVTSVATSGAITGGTITGTGTIAHSTAAGNKHVPTGGSSGQFLKYSSSGTAVWATPSYTTNTDTWRTISNSVSTTSSTVSASQTAVKSAYDIGNHSHPYLGSTAKAADSNLLDGIDSTYFNRGSNIYGAMVGTSGWNLNTVFSGSSTNRNGFFDAWSGTNFPSGMTHVHGIQVRHNTTTHYGWQLVTQYNISGKLKFRQVSNNSWTSWYDVWTSGNDGSGSGLDADLLDGQQGSYWGSGGGNQDTTYSADGNYGMTLSGTTFRLEDDRRRNSSTTDIYSGNTSDYTFYDASIGIRWYTAGAEDMRLTDAGDLHVDNDIIAFSTTISDERLKHDIKPIENALDKVGQLNGCTFTYTADGKESAGLIAQDVEKVLPSAVTEKELPLKIDDGQKYKVLQYDQTIGLLVEAIKELTAKVKELESR